MIQSQIDRIYRNICLLKELKQDEIMGEARKEELGK